MYSHMWSTIIKDWVTLPNNAEKVFMLSLNQHGQGLRDKRSIQIMGKDYYQQLLTLEQKEFDFVLMSLIVYLY